MFGPKVENIENFAEYWAESLNVDINLIKKYPKSSNGESKEPIMHLRTPNRTISEIIQRLLAITKEDVPCNKFAAGHFISGVFAGDGSLAKSKEKSLNYVSLSFDPNKLDKSENEFSLYIKCLKKIGIKTEDRRLYLTEHEKCKVFIDKINEEIPTRIRKSNSLGFGGEILIFKYRSFKILNDFKIFHPNSINRRKFSEAFNRINRDKVRYW